MSDSNQYIKLNSLMCISLSFPFSYYLFQNTKEEVDDQLLMVTIEILIALTALRF